MAARRHDNFIGDQLFDAGALRVPNNGRVPLSSSAARLVFQTPTPAEAHSLFGTSGSNTMPPMHM